MAAATISLVVRRTILLYVALRWAVPLACWAQDTICGQPQVKLLNACAALVQEQQEMSTALDRMPSHPEFSQNFEVERGRSILQPDPDPWPALTGQLPESPIIADLVRRPPGDSAMTTSAAMLAATMARGRMKLDRYGKSSVALAGCRGAGERQAQEESAYEPPFCSTSSILTNYRGLLGAKNSDIGRNDQAKL